MLRGARSGIEAYLRNGGYYFAINDYVDLQVDGRYLHQRLMGVQAQSNYRKRYRYSGSINANYIKTRRRATRWRVTHPSSDFQIRWSHQQDLGQPL